MICMQGLVQGVGGDKVGKMERGEGGMGKGVGEMGRGTWGRGWGDGKGG
jgi:hypothetical protein